MWWLNWRSLLDVTPSAGKHCNWGSEVSASELRHTHWPYGAFRIFADIMHGYSEVSRRHEMSMQREKINLAWRQSRSISKILSASGNHWRPYWSRRRSGL
jgi:hypothetical protein